MLNKTVYVADGASKKVREGIVAGSVVNREGFEIVTVKVLSINNPDKYVGVTHGTLSAMNIETGEVNRISVDEYRDNNKITNLVILCPICHRKITNN